MMRLSFKKISLSLLLLFIFIPSLAYTSEPVSTGFLGNNAIGKHDTTAYHLQSSAKKGDKRYKHTWQGAEWYFANAEQRDMFAVNPEKYSPAYNGFCSNALTLDEGLISTDGTVWHIFEDKLHLFFAERGRLRWINGDYQELKRQADAAWQQQLEIAKAK